MHRRPVSIVLCAAGLLAVLVAAGCGSRGVASPTPNTVVGTLPKPTTPTAGKGNPAAGKAVYVANGCGSCHTYTPAGSTGKIGPDLDQLPSYAAKAGQPLEEFTSGAITSPPPKYVPPGYPTNVMPATFGTTIKPQELADLVAFLTQKP
jgi:mono/diheme cytochrome c family protein